MPTPRANETEREFISRCVVDPEAVADFPDSDQRLAFCYSQYERQEKSITLKRFDKDKWQNAFERQLDIVEGRNIGKVKRFYRDNYNKGIESFVGANQTDFQLLFPTEQLYKLYRELYEDIGMHFAKWYARNFDRLQKKAFNVDDYLLQWEASFAALGSAVGAQRVTLVQGTALSTLQRITRAYLSDPEFMSLGATQKAVILRRQFSGYTQYQAERLVRTESTYCANFAMGESAKTLFPEQQLMKEWIAAFDDRTRDSHAEAGAGEPIKASEPFMVGGQLMMYAGDPAGGAAEVINCRCSTPYFPQEGAVASGDFTDIGFGIGGGSFTGI